MPTTAWSSCGARRARCSQGVLDLGRGGTFQSRTERDIVVRTSLARLEQLDIGDQALYFGRIDRLPEPGDDVGVETPLLGESFHIGRLAVSGPDHEPLVVDWRAPVAEPFYRATGLDPQGLARRRHLAVRGRTVLGLEDEYFVDPDGRPARAGPGAGPAAPSSRDGGERLLVRTGWCWAVRAPCFRRWARPARVRWATSSGRFSTSKRYDSFAPARCARRPGWARHGKDGGRPPRAAYLLYTHRFPLERQGVLVVGPKPVVPAVHRTGPAVARRDRGQPLDCLGAGARGPCPRRRRVRPWPS